MKFYVFFILFINALGDLRASQASPCDPNNSVKSKEKLIRHYQPKMAKFFSISYFKSHKVIKSKNHIYCLKNQMKNGIVTSTTHLPFFSSSNFQNKLIAFPGTQYISGGGFDVSKIRNIKSPLDVEEIVALKPDFLMTHKNSMNSNSEEILKKFNIQLVYNYDHEETHPLARAEWIIFVSALYNLEDKYILEFENIFNKYHEIKNKISQEKMIDKPIVLIGDIKNGKWHTPGGKSDLGVLVQDAGGELLFKNNHYRTQEYSLEELFKLLEVKKERVKFWLPHNNFKAKNDFSRDRYYSLLTSFLNDVKVFNNNKKLNQFGFNEYWQEGMSRPDLLLSDLHNIFSVKDYSNLNWYQELK